MFGTTALVQLSAPAPRCRVALAPRRALLPTQPAQRHVFVARAEPVVHPATTDATEATVWKALKGIIGNIWFKCVGALALAVALVVITPSAAEAARSGGRMGGSGFSSAKSFSGGTRSYGGAGGGAYGSPRMGPAPQQYSSGSTTIITPSYGFGWGMSPFGYGYGAPMGGGGSLFTFFILAIFAYVAFNTITASMGGEEEYEEDIDNAPMSVVKIQVGLLGSARDLQRDLNRMGNTVDTSTPQGLHYLLTETVLALRRNPQYAVYGKSELEKTRGLDNAESKFNTASMEERGKFARETLSNVSGRTTRSAAKVQGDGANELIVVTLIAAIDGKVEPTQISTQEDLKSNLALVGGVPADRLLALEVLWTPQDENDYFTKEELITDYPTLNML